MISILWFSTAFITEVSQSDVVKSQSHRSSKGHRSMVNIYCYFGPKNLQKVFLLMLLEKRWWEGNFLLVFLFF